MNKKNSILHMYVPQNFAIILVSNIVFFSDKAQQKYGVDTI